MKLNYLNDSTVLSVFVVQLDSIDGIENLGIFSTSTLAEKFIFDNKYQEGEVSELYKILITEIELNKAVSF